MSTQNNISDYVKRMMVTASLVVALGVLLIVGGQQLVSYKKASTSARQEKIDIAKADIKRLVEREINKVEESRKMLIKQSANELTTIVKQAAVLANKHVDIYSSQMSRSQFQKSLYVAADAYNSNLKSSSVSIISYDGVMLYSLKYPQLVGKNYKEERDELGNYAFQDEMRSLQDAECAVVYSSNNPEILSETQGKITVVHRLDALGCYLMVNMHSSEYITRLEETEGRRSSFQNYNYDAYLFIWDSKGRSVVRGGQEYTPDRPNLLQDSNVEIAKSVQRVIDSCLVSPEGTYVDYIFYDNDGVNTAPKTSYVAYYAPCDWVIGIGFYYEDMDQELDGKIKQIKKGAVLNVALILLFLTLVILFETTVAHRFHVRLNYDFQVFTNIFSSRKTMSQRINPEAMWFDETKNLADYVNMKNIELDKAFREIKIEHARAEESDRLKTAFLANLSHEVRTPMNAIVGFSSMLAEELDTETRVELISLIHESSDQLLTLIEDIVEMSKIESSIMETTQEEVRMGDLFDKICKYYLDESKRQCKNLQFVPKNNLGGDFVFAGDAENIIKVSKLLLNNAIKFTSEGSVIYQVNLTEKGLLFKVIDTGIGIAEEYSSAIFNRFTQVQDADDNQLSRDHRGVGVGLTLCKQIVEMMGGQIWVDSTLGIGSTFQFLLPYEQTAEK